MVWVNGRKHEPEIHWGALGREQYRIVYVNGVGQTPRGKKYPLEPAIASVADER